MLLEAFRGPFDIGYPLPDGFWRDAGPGAGPLGPVGRAENSPRTSYPYGA